MTPVPGHIYRGEVVHKRVRPVEHRLSYKVFSLALDVDKIDEASSQFRLFKHNGFSLFSLYQKDHGYRDGSTLSHFAWSEVKKAGLTDDVERIVMLFYPRILGYAFNPLTVYFCLDKSGHPRLMIYEVRNTFGEDLTYVLRAGDARNDTYTHTTPKEFYVSPFNDVEGEYTFHVIPPADNLTVGVALKTENSPLLRTHFRGAQRTLTDKNLLKVFFAYPLMTAKIVAGIHWEALKLWRKGLGLKDRPKAPEHRILHG